jgi:DNA-binding transcriptional MerR regulator
LPQLNPLKRSGGRRFYRPEDVALVRDVQRLIEQDGFTLDGAARALRRGAPLAPQPSTALVNDTGAAADILPQLRAIRDRLARALG